MSGLCIGNKFIKHHLQMQERRVYMNEKGERINVKIIRETYVSICTSDFFEEGEFSNGYEIVRVAPNYFGLIRVSEPECKIFFKKIIKLKEDCYLLYCKNNQKAFLKIERGKVFLSDYFKDVIEIFEKYILVNDLLGERKLLPMDYFQKLEFCIWPNHTATGVNVNQNHAIMNLLNGRQKILLKEGLTVSDIEFDFVSEKFGVEVNNIFRVVCFKDEGKKAVIRIKDLKVSEHFHDIKGAYCGRFIQTEYVEIPLDEKKVAVLKIDDFKLSKGYDEIEYVSAQYALITNEGNKNVFRLSDFVEASWPEN